MNSMTGSTSMARARRFTANASQPAVPAVTRISDLSVYFMTLVTLMIEPWFPLSFSTRLPSLQYSRYQIESATKCCHTPVSSVRLNPRKTHCITQSCSCSNARARFRVDETTSCNSAHRFFDSMRCEHENTRPSAFG